MAPPRAAGPRRSQAPSEHIYTLGERGRKTGVTLRDTGVRDEHGMEPMESIFSSPTKSADGDAHDASEEEQEAEDEEDGDDDDDGSEVDMDLTTASGPDPAALLNGQSTAARLAMRQARSPATARSLFGSPAVRAGLNNKGANAAGDQNQNKNQNKSQSQKSGALRQNQLLRPPPSPDAANAPPSSPVKPVKRRLDFGKAVPATTHRKPVLLPAAATRRVDEDEEEEEDDEETILHGNQDGGADDSMQMIDEPNEVDQDEQEQPSTAEETPDEDEEEKGEEEEEAEEPVLPAKRRGRPPAKKNATQEKKKEKESAGKAAANGTKRRRSGRASGASDTLPSPAVEADEEQSSAKRQRTEPKPRGRPKGRQEDGHDDGEEGQASQAGKGGKQAAKKKPQQADPAEPAEPATKKKGRPRKSSGVGAAMAAAAAVPRGPPLPKSRGLVIRRRENDEDGSMKRTRSGRTSYQPLAFWRNEHAEFETSEMADSPWRNHQKGTGRRIVMPEVREIYRVEEEDLPPLSGAGRGGSHRGRGGSQRRHRRGPKRRGDGDDDDDDDDGGGGPERQAWEYDPGRVQGKVALWRPEHELDPPGPEDHVDQADSQIALSALAIQTQDVRDGSFRFAKTLSLPFFGTGIVDLAPGAEKRPKNSRKMHMAFFVHYGHVAVTVNETEFRITKGGMWSVPRGNYYSIVNDTDRPARIFFSQGCEMLTVLEPEEEEE